MTTCTLPERTSSAIGKSRLGYQAPAGARIAMAIADPAERPLVAHVEDGHSPVLLAFAGTPGCVAAARTTVLLAEQRGAKVHVLTVVDTRSAPIPPPLDIAIGLADSTYGEEVHAERMREFRASLSAAVGRNLDWPMEIRLGAPPRAIVTAASRVRAALVVLGLRHHHAVDRAINLETTLNVMQWASCPVLGVTPELTGLPRRVMVATDFGPASLAAARAALVVADSRATLLLAYAAPSRLTGPSDEGERLIRDLGVIAAFERFERELGAPAGMTIERVVLERASDRSVAATLLDYAGASAIDLIVLGSMRHGRIERWMLGSVTTDVARAGSHSLLVVPPTVPGS